MSHLYSYTTCRVSKYLKIYDILFQVKSVEAKEALRLQKENNFVILDVRPEAEFKEVSELVLEVSFSDSNMHVPS